MLTKKTFIQAAKIVSSIADESQREIAASAFVELFRADNPRFQISRFLDACDLPTPDDDGSTYPECRNAEGESA